MNIVGSPFHFLSTFIATASRQIYDAPILVLFTEGHWFYTSSSQQRVSRARVALAKMLRWLRRQRAIKRKDLTGC